MIVAPKNYDGYKYNFHHEIDRLNSVDIIVTTAKPAKSESCVIFDDSKGL